MSQNRYSEESLRAWKEHEHAIVENIRRSRAISSQQSDANRSALANARMIADFRAVSYPQGIEYPCIKFNSRPLCYGRTFLLQFRPICTNKPDDLPPLEQLEQLRIVASSTERGKTQPHITSTLGKVKSGELSGRRPTDHARKGENQTNNLPTDNNPSVDTAGRSLESTASSQQPLDTSRTVESLVKTLTAENFDVCSDEIVEHVNQSGSLITEDAANHIALSIIERAISSEAYTEICARLYDKVMNNINPLMRSDVRNAQGKFMSGSRVLRRYIMKGCKDRWNLHKPPYPKNAARKGKGHANAFDALIVTNPEENPSKESIESSPRVLLAKFAGEMFLVRRMTEKIILHEYVQKPLECVGDPDETDIVSLCVLLSTVGGRVDIPRNANILDAVFARMKHLAKRPQLDTEIKRRLHDIINLRTRRWDM
ncbi:hypothetical protein QCA50_005042 [Cerrena zonata]|uniref:MIF4G domain-containing protein n=1 Tax=Cerrena zonata TaxID=2478898 RepID=A0AAW0GDN6_9APHY